MIRKIEALRYRCLLDIEQTVPPFLLLLGPNASGKSTLLDVIGLIGDMLKDGPAQAVRSRGSNLADLVFDGKGARFELAVELEIPQPLRRERNGRQTHVRYEIALGHGGDGALALLAENLWLKPADESTTPTQRQLFPSDHEVRDLIVRLPGKQTPSGWRKVISKTAETGNDYYKSETGNWTSQFRLGPHRAALSNLPEDEERFPVATWAKRALMEGVRRVVLNSERLRKPAPPGSPVEFLPDGSNLPWVLHHLKSTNPEQFGRWLAHVRTALPDVRDIDTVQREEDKQRYLRVTYRSGPALPSWVISDGTLRLLGLTAISFVDAPHRTLLIEEPENGIHPQALECVFQALASGYAGQVLCASHSPIFLALASLDQVLCFARSEAGATDVVLGPHHPRLANWQRDSNLGLLFAAGVLG